MNFTIFRNFSGIFLNLFDFYFDFYHLKEIKNHEKMGVILRMSTWHRHVDKRERLHGVEVTHGTDVTWRIFPIYTIYTFT